LEPLLPGKLLLLPNLLHEGLVPELFFPKAVQEAVSTLDGLICESEKEGRRYLRRFVSHEKMAQTKLALLNEHTDPNQLQSLMQCLEQNEVWGLISDAGLAAVADPGADLVFLARQKGVEIRSLGGTSSLLLALQLSGFSGQKFSFHGYLPREDLPLEQALKNLEASCKGTTQIWIEAPYRTQKMVEKVLSILSPTTHFCVASDLMSSQEKVISEPISKWKKSPVQFGKSPAVFLLFRH
jgi:16S rRNA (cytidine1402-2'-O)-methyltransferase